ncbi:ADP-ribosylglycohydrolase family protein [Streptomyces sp. NPDC001633]|uniref:ADP-ribosylglycohydrolase family protein n=1 Tax=Streptomyces sp. NPDC001633 TaxID=3364595 RepID=UPI0036B4A003
MTAKAPATARRSPAGPLRLTWVQPEDLLGHELRQAAEDGRDAAAVARIARRWQSAGGSPAPDRAGASDRPADPALRATATALLDELIALPSPLADDEPTELTAIQTACSSWPLAATGRVGERPAATRLEAAWLGRAAGCLLGKPVEKLPLEGIRALARATGNWPLTSYFTEEGLDPAVAARYPWNRRSRATSLAGVLDGMPEDDDLNYPLLNLLLLERHGPDFTTADVARLWLDELPAGRTFTAERIAYRNLLEGIEPPHTARHRNPFREWIGAQIRADVFGWTRPGDPAAAAALAWRDATLSHTAGGVHAAMFTAAALAAAGAGGTDVHGALRAGLSVVPPRSRLARAVRRGIALACEAPDRSPAGFAAVADQLHRTYGHYHWVHAVPNAALLAAALTHADGDFAGSICRTVSGGWDTDSNGATAGSLAGLLAGAPDALPGRWTAPLRNRLATGIGGLDGIGFDALAHRTAALVVPPDRVAPPPDRVVPLPDGVSPDRISPYGVSLDRVSPDRPEATAP